MGDGQLEVVRRSSWRASGQVFNFVRRPPSLVVIT